MEDYFPESDFTNAQPACTKNDMNEESLTRFNIARHMAGVPFVVNSAFRSVQHENNKGRAGTSAHTRGTAMDIACATSSDRFIIVNALLKAGFNRIGIANTYIHADNDKQNFENVIWTY